MLLEIARKLGIKKYMAIEDTLKQMLQNGLYKVEWHELGKSDKKIIDY